jgi:hypothetical protein
MKYFLIPLLTVLIISCDLETESETRNKTVLLEKNTEIKTIKNEEKKIDSIFVCPQYVFESIKQQADTLKLFMKNALDSSLIKSNKWEEKFFCAFPNSFKEMELLFGDPRNNGLYHTKFVENRSIYESMSPYIHFFESLNSIPDEQYYDKYINICINGKYQADNIQTAFGFGNRLLNYPIPTCLALEKRNDKDIKSVFRFIFDNVHPSRKRTKVFYNNLLLVLNNENVRIAKLLTDSYEKLMTENHEH